MGGYTPKTEVLPMGGYTALHGNPLIGGGTWDGGATVRQTVAPPLINTSIVDPQWCHLMYLSTFGHHAHRIEVIPCPVPFPRTSARTPARTSSRGRHGEGEGRGFSLPFDPCHAPTGPEVSVGGLEEGGGT